MVDGNDLLGQYTIEQIQPQPDGTPSKIKVKVRLNRNGIFDVTQASLIETIEEPSVPAGANIVEIKKRKFHFFVAEESMETGAPAAKVTENGGDQNTATTAEPMDEVS